MLLSEPFLEYIFHLQDLCLETQFIILGSWQRSVLWIQKLLTDHFHFSVSALLCLNPGGFWQDEDSGSAPPAKDTMKKIFISKRQPSA